MRKLILLSAIVILGFTSCKKEEVSKDHKIPFGTWYSEKPLLQFNIKDLDGSGYPFQYTEIDKNGKTFLQIQYQDYEGSKKIDLYEILSVTSDTIKAIDTTDPNKKEIVFKKVKSPY